MSIPDAAAPAPYGFYRAAMETLGVEEVAPRPSRFSGALPFDARLLPVASPLEPAGPLRAPVLPRRNHGDKIRREGPPAPSARQGGLDHGEAVIALLKINRP